MCSFNLLSRSSTLIEKGFQGLTPACLKSHVATKKLIAQATDLADQVKEAINTLAPQKAPHLIMHFLNATNSYLEEMRPWVTLKEFKANPSLKDQQALAAEALYSCLEALRISGILLYPIMPIKMNELLKRIHWHQDPCFADAKKCGLLQEGSPIERSSPLFPRIEFDSH